MLAHPPGQDDVQAATRGLIPSLTHAIPAPAAVESFQWIIRPPDNAVRARFYTDGSLLDGPTALLGRCGWAFTAVAHDGTILAQARGVPPPWIRDIAGTESWALFQAALVALLGSDFRMDCKPVFEAVMRGIKWATGPKRPLARVHGLMLAALEGVPLEAFAWMPAHTRPSQIGVIALSNDDLLTEIDRDANEESDVHAKAAVEAHRVQEELRDAVALRDSELDTAAKWLGRVTYILLLEV